MADQFRLVTHYSTVPQMVDEADFLIALSDARPIKGDLHRKTLAASAAVVLAVCLDQGTSGILDYFIQTKRASGGAAAFQTLLSESLRQRVIRLPEVVTNSKLQLNKNSPHVFALHELISLRNGLMHIREEADIEYLNYVPGDKEIALPEPRINNPWFFVRLEDVQRFREAVALYAEEVLLPSAQTIRKGKIVIEKTW